VVVADVAARAEHGRLTAAVRLETPAQVHAFLLDGAQPRLVVDLPAAVWLHNAALTPHAQAQFGPVRARFARRTPAASRLVFDLPAPGLELRSEKRLVDGGIEVAFSLRLAPGAETFPPPPPAAAAANSRPTPAAPPALAPRPEPPAGERPLIVLDAGHGGKDPGTVPEQAGVQEKDITLAAALELEALLRKRGYEVRLTRGDDSFVPLETRVERARAWGADLFLSLHADSGGAAHVAGASVYTLSEAGGRRARRLHSLTNWAGPEADPRVEDILFDLTLASSSDRSSAFAETLLRNLAGAAPLLRNSRRTAGFYVLLAPDVPAVLLEMGFLTNPADAARLASSSGRARLLKAVAAAIDEHFQPRTLLASVESGRASAAP
jgi:N-acetylmuramoyl-L-alanine amidase